jgi:choline kinase
VGPKPEVLNRSLFPTRSERDNFYLAYLQSGLVLDSVTGSTAVTESPLSTPARSRHSSSAQLSTPSKTPPLAQFTPMTQMETTVGPEDMELLEQQVMRWVPTSHALWAVWAIVQARDNIELHNRRLDGKHDEDSDDDTPIEFDYLKYASARIETFRDMCQSMGTF